MSPEQAALWRAFYRTGGLSQRVFSTVIAKHMTIKTYDALTVLDTDNFFFILYKGTAQIAVSDEGVMTHTRKVTSGQMFDVKKLDLLHFVEHFNGTHVDVTSITPVTVFAFHADEISAVAHHPKCVSVWQQLLVENLSQVALRLYQKDHQSEVMREDHVSPLFEPLKLHEEPNSLAAGSAEALRTPLRHVFSSAVKFLSLPWPFMGAPVGLRHNLPVPPRDVSVIPSVMMRKPGSASLKSIIRGRRTWKKEEYPEMDMSSKRKTASIAQKIAESVLMETMDITEDGEIDKEDVEENQVSSVDA